MGWNEPDDNDPDKKRDPWGRPKKGKDGPPDLEELLGKLRDVFSELFGSRQPGRSSGSGKGNGKGPGWGNLGGRPLLPMLGIAGIILLGFVLYDITHFVDQRERGVVLRLGKHVRTMGPGLNFRFPRPIEKLYRVNVGQVRSISHKATMLTQDENIVDVEVAVQWRIGEPEKYLFNVLDPEGTLKQVTESAVREIIGKSQLDFIFTEGRNEIARRQQALIQETLIDYAAGIIILGVEMQPAKPPEQVKAAFDDAIKAREDEQRLVNEAEAYRNDIIPKARGGAARLREESNAYKSRVIAKAEGEASRFEQLLQEYQLAPEVTRQRLYLDTMEEVMSNSNKVLMDAEGSNSLMYLPLDQLISPGGRKSSTSGSGQGEMMRRIQQSGNSANAESNSNMRDLINRRLRGQR